MSKIDLTGLSPEITAYIHALETQLEKQTQRSEKLTAMLINLQKSMYGQSSEKSTYVLGEDKFHYSMKLKWSTQPMHQNQSVFQLPDILVNPNALKKS